MSIEFIAGWDISLDVFVFLPLDALFPLLFIVWDVQTASPFEILSFGPIGFSHHNDSKSFMNNNSAFLTQYSH